MNFEKIRDLEPLPELQDCDSDDGADGDGGQENDSHLVQAYVKHSEPLHPSTTPSYLPLFFLPFLSPLPSPCH